MEDTQSAIYYGKQPAPIGVFDSGYGGLTVLNELLGQFPGYDFIYLGDNARTPYGTRSFEVVYRYTLQAVQHLFAMGVHLVILACNTASAKALRTIQQHDLPGMDPSRRVLGVVRPSAEEIGKLTASGHVGVLGTNGTVLSLSYPLEIKKLYPHLLVTQQACPLWVPLVENGEFDSPGAAFFVKRDLDQLFKEDPQIDALILGCTHYPLLLPLIKEFVPAGVAIMSQGEVVAASLKDYLKRHPQMEQKCSRGASCRFYTTEDTAKFDKTTQLFMKREVNARHLEID